MMDGGTLAEAKRHRDGRYGRLGNAALHRQLHFVAIPRHPDAADDDCVGTIFVAPRQADFVSSSRARSPIGRSPAKRLSVPSPEI